MAKELQFERPEDRYEGPILRALGGLVRTGGLIIGIALFGFLAGRFFHFW